MTKLARDPSLLLVLLVLAAPLAAGAGCSREAHAAAPIPAAAASRGPVLVELFTSQGCSSCPAADAFVRDLPRLGFGRDRVVPLTFHVDYWDGLGWPDPFASPAYTERQHRYVSTGALTAPNGEDGIHGAYTPQMIVGGQVHFSGGRRDVALAEIAHAEQRAPSATLTAEAATAADRATITARLAVPSPAGARDAGSWRSWRLLVALAEKGARTRVQRGENAGETLEEAAIVRVLSPPAPITIAAPVQVTLAKPRDLDWANVELVAFVQSEATLRIVAARAVPLPAR